MLSIVQQTNQMQKPRSKIQLPSCKYNNHSYKQDYIQPQKYHYLNCLQSFQDIEQAEVQSKFNYHNSDLQVLIDSNVNFQCLRLKQSFQDVDTQQKVLINKQQTNCSISEQVTEQGNIQSGVLTQMICSQEKQLTFVDFHNNQDFNQFQSQNQSILDYNSNQQILQLGRRQFQLQSPNFNNCILNYSQLNNVNHSNNHMTDLCCSLDYLMMYKINLELSIMAPIGRKAIFLKKIGYFLSFEPQQSGLYDDLKIKQQKAWPKKLCYPCIQTIKKLSQQVKKTIQFGQFNDEDDFIEVVSQIEKLEDLYSQFRKKIYQCKYERGFQQQVRKILDQESVQQNLLQYKSKQQKQLSSDLKQIKNFQKLQILFLKDGQKLYRNLIFGYRMYFDGKSEIVRDYQIWRFYKNLYKQKLCKIEKYIKKGSQQYKKIVDTFIQKNDKAAIIQLKNQLAILKNQLADYKKENFNLRNQLAILKNQLADQKKENFNLRNQLADQKKENFNLRNQIADQKKENFNLRNQIANLKQIIADLKHGIDQQKKRQKNKKQQTKEQSSKNAQKYKDFQCYDDFDNNVD